MSHRSWIDRIKDILTSAEIIRDFVGNMSLEEFLNDPRTIRAVAFEFTTMGEAARMIPDDIQEIYQTIPWGKMQGLRNVLIHEYFRLDEEIIWKTVVKDIPELIENLKNLLAEI